MNLVSVYVTVGAISLVKPEFYNSVTPHQSWQHGGDPVHEDDWRQANSNLGPGRPETGGMSERKRDFSRVFDQMKNIYFQCKTKVNKRYKTLIKTKLKSSRVSELKTYVSSMYQCVKFYTFRSLDEILQDDIIRVTDYAYFVKDGINVTEDLSPGRTARADRSIPFKDYAVRVLGQGLTSLVSDRIETLLRTHSLKFQLNNSLVAEGRSRRRDHRMFAMLVMGFIIMASILIPMGFQFLTVLGGKSLLLAKLALIISAISGLKKIATSNVGYGFYHTGNDGHHHDHIHHGFHEKHYNPQNHNLLQGYN